MNPLEISALMHENGMKYGEVQHEHMTNLLKAKVKL